MKRCKAVGFACVGSYIFVEATSVLALQKADCYRNRNKHLGKPWR